MDSIEQSKTTKILLCALTGMGNNILLRLNSLDWVNLVALFTVSYPSPYPYYPCKPIKELAESLSIPVFNGLSMKSQTTIELITSMEPDLIIVGSYYDIIPKEIISIPKKGVINVHPSLLPKYRGPTPTFWTIMNGEKYTGITVHFIDDETIDSGRIICQQVISVQPSDTDGQLRFRIAENSSTVIEHALNLIYNKEIDFFPEQDILKAEYYPKNKNFYVNENNNYIDLDRFVRAMTPYPGARITINGKVYLVRNIARIEKQNSCNLGWERDDTYIGKVGDGFARYIVKQIYD